MAGTLRGCDASILGGQGGIARDAPGISCVSREGRYTLVCNMLDDTQIPTATAPRHQRIAGEARVVLGSDGRLKDLRQQGSAKAMLPKVYARAPEVVFLNTAGGVTGGDRLSYGVSLADGSTAVGTTQTAERAYRAEGVPGRIDTHLRIGAGARLHWLPQELILFEGAAIERRLTVEMAADAELVMLETLVLGRAAMGERLASLHLRDRREVIRGGRPAMIEAIALDDADLTRPGVAGLNGAIAVASLSLFAPRAEDRLDAMRACLDDMGAQDETGLEVRAVRAACSAWDGRLMVRLMAADAYDLRRAVARAVPVLTQAALPRVWQI